MIGTNPYLLNAFRGNLGDIRVYNYAINSNQVSNLYLDRNLVNYYKFDTSLNNTNIPNYATLLFDASLVGNVVMQNSSVFLTNVADLSASQYVYSTSPNITSLTSGLTISCWINTTGIPNRLMRIFDITSTIGYPGISLDISGITMLNNSYTNPRFISTILRNSTYGTINSISINDFGNMVMATSNGIYYSYNFGKDWNISNLNTSNWLSVSLINNGNALACRSSAVYFSSNNGKTWTITGASSGFAYFSICLSSSGYAIAIGLLSTSSLYSSGNFSTWSSSTIGIQALTIGLASNGVGIVGGNQQLAITKNNGQTWTVVPISGGSGPVPWAHSGNISDNGKYMIANSNSPGNLYYSTNSGDTWNYSNNEKSNLAGILAVGNNGIAFNRQNNTPAPIHQTDLTKDKIMVYTSYDQVAANIAICPSGLFVSFIVANDVNSKKLIVKTT